MGFFNRIRADPGFVSPVRSDPGFVGPIQSDPIRSDPDFVNGHRTPCWLISADAATKPDFSGLK